MIGASIAMAVLIYFFRPEYYRLSTAIMMIIINWYVIRTVIDYATGSPMVIFLVRIQNAERRVARTLMVIVVTFTLLVFYVAMLERWFDPV